MVEAGKEKLQSHDSRYRLLRPLGKGGMGEVLLAADDDLNHPVALKFLHPTLPAQALRFFREEARLLTRLSHPNLVKIFDFYEGGLGVEGFPSGACISMEFVEGPYLADLAGAPRPAEQWIQLFIELCQGLLYLHNRGILHRDLKPSNVLVTAANEIKILDFGLAALQTEISRGTPALGTLAYMPPEAYWGEYDAQSDLFSLGVLFYEAITGRLPFNKPLSQIGNPPPQAAKLKDLKPELPDFFTELIHRLMELNPERRPSSCLALIRFINQHVATPYPILDADSSETVLLKAPIVGRETEFGEAWSFWERIGGSIQPGALSLTGPTGIGRSRFVEELKWRIQLSGDTFLAISHPAGGRWLESLLNRLSTTPAPPIVDFFSGIDLLLASLKQRRVVLAFTDLHNWDAGALQILGILLVRAKRASGAILIVLEYNQDLATPELEAWLAQRELWPENRDIVLGDLNAETTRQLILTSAIDAPLSTEAVDAVVQVSGGRPLLVIEAVRHVLQSQQAGAEIHFQIPQNLREASQLRLESLSDPARQLLAWIAVHPEPASAGQWADLESASADDAGLRELDREGFLRKRSQQEPGLQLAHPSLRDTYLEKLPADEVREAHRHWLQALLCEGDEPVSGNRALCIAEHALGADDADTFKKWGGVAAEYCLRLGAETRAIEIFLALLAGTSMPYERTVWNAHLAPLYYKLGRYQDAIDAYDRWFAEREDDSTFLQKRKHYFYTGLVYFTWGKRAEARARLEASLGVADSEQYPKHRPYHVRALNILAALAEKKGDLPVATRLLEQSLPLAQCMPLELGEIEQRLGKLAQLEQRHGDAKSHFQRSLLHFESAQNLQAQAISYNSLGMLDHETAEIADAFVAMKHAVDCARRSGELQQYGRYKENLGLVYLEAARYGESQAELEVSEDLLQIFGTENDRLLMKAHRVDIFLRVGNLDQALVRMRELQEQRATLEEMGIWHEYLLLHADWAYQTHRWAEAAEFYRRAYQQSSVKHQAQAWVARLGEIRARWRSDPNAPAGLEPGESAELAKIASPYLACWLQTLQFVGADPNQLDEIRLLDLLKTVKANQRPESRMDLYGLLAQIFLERGWSNLARRLKLAAEAEFVYILQSLPEELKMDFEKNRSLNSLDQALGDVLPAPAADAAAAPKPPANEAAQISENRFRQYSEINRQIAQKTDLGDILERVMDAAIELTGAERGFLLMKDPAGQAQMIKGYTVKTARHLNQGSLGEEDFQFSMTAVKQAVDQGTYLLTDNAQLDPRFQEKTSVMQFQLKSILVVPLELDGQVLGGIYLDHRYQPNCFAPEDVTLLTAFASQAALAIQKAQMMEELRRAKEKLEVEVKDQARHIEVLSGELKQMRDQLRYEYKEIVGQSPSMMQVFQLLDHVTETTIPVWIWGESGTGKELIARSLHFNSPRKAGPFVTENCSSIPETLLESELFGHKKGSFTHADRDRIGLFEQAHGGTLFLDEIADMSLGMQAKLLRVLQEGEIRPIGGSKKIKVDVRLVTASNKDLNQMVKDEKYRQDLFFRINGMTIKLPPLRERKDDIPMLVDHMIKKIAKDFGLLPAEVTDDAYQAMFRYPWPGNIRELEGVMRNALLFAKGRTITPEFLSLNASMTQPGGGSATAKGASRSVQEEQSEERQMILDALKRHQMDKEKVAGELGISLRSLYTRLEKLGIPKKKTLLAKYLNLK